MQKNDNMMAANNAHRRVKPSTTLNRKYVKRPVKDTGNSVQIKRFGTMVTSRSTIAKQTGAMTKPKTAPMIKQSAKKPRQSTTTSDMLPAQSHPMQTTARARMQMRANAVKQPQVSKMTAQELKEQAIKKALAGAAKTPSLAEQAMPSEKKKGGKIKFGTSRVILALSCAAAVVFAIAYFINFSMPDISLRVAAMQTGINASYPGYIPRDFKLSGITSENNKITLNFDNSASDTSFSLIEEKSHWDSNALLNNYVKEAYGENYSIVREQGLTIYISGSNATWVNNGIVYKLTAEGNILNNKQIRSIAVSL